jgi:hypothetical protein
MTLLLSKHVSIKPLGPIRASQVSPPTRGLDRSHGRTLPEEAEAKFLLLALQLRFSFEMSAPGFSLVGAAP